MSFSCRTAGPLRMGIMPGAQADPVQIACWAEAAIAQADFGFEAHVGTAMPADSRCDNELSFVVDKTVKAFQEIQVRIC